MHAYKKLELATAFIFSFLNIIVNVNLGLRNPVIMAVSPGSCIEGEPMSGLSAEMKKASF